MADNVFVIPATLRVGRHFPPYLPLADGSLKPIAECTRAEVAEAVDECREVAATSRARLENADREHIGDLEALAHLAAYLDRFERWPEVREGGPVREMLWRVDPL